MTEYTFSVFTPSYNRAKTLPRLYEALKRQTYKNFEWIIVDDGSADNTKEVVQTFIDDKPDFNIIYKYQTNKGKHIATNVAAQMAKGEFFITIDSDDTVKDNALEVFLDEWNKIPDVDKPKFKGISCRTCDENGKTNGCALPSEHLDCSDLDLRLKYKIDGELWGMTRLEIVKNNPFPTVSGLHFYPESIYWDNIGRKYTTRFIDIPLRYYINDQENALTGDAYSAHKETIFIRLHYINECWDYRKADPKFFIKQFAGLSRDGLLNGKKFSEIRKMPDTTAKRAITTMLYPLGYFLYKKQSGGKKK